LRHPHPKFRPFRLWLGLGWAVVCGIALAAPLKSQQQGAKSASTVASTPQEAQLSPALKQLLEDAWGLYEKHQNDAARERFERALTMAREEKNVWGEGEIHRGFGLLAYIAADYPTAQAEYEQALKLFEYISAPSSIARVHIHLGVIANYMGRRTEAVELYRKALSEYEELHDLSGQAAVLEKMTSVDTLARTERDAYAERGLGLARKLGDKKLEGAFLHGIGDSLFMKGNFAGAIENLEKAATCFAEVDDQRDLAYVSTSMGRLYRMHGAYEEAIEYYKKGLLIQQELGDKMGVIQSLNAMAISYGLSEHAPEAMEHYERALALARETGSPRVIAFMTGNVGSAYIGKGNYKRAIELLEESVRLDPSSVYTGNRYVELSLAYRTAKQYERALESANEAVRLTHKGTDPDILYQALQERAHVYQALERYSEALADTQEAIHAVEQIRSKLVAADYLKQGYAGRTQDLFADAIRIQEKLGQHKEAMVVAEEARARAFLDLLASRGLEQRTPQSTPLTAAKDTPGTSSFSSLPSSEAKKEERSGLTTLGSAPLEISEAHGAPMLPSPSSAAPPTFEELLATAKRLDSTLLSYWVAQDTTFIWVLRPDGVVRSERAPITSEQLSKLIRLSSTYREREPRAEPTLEAKRQTNAHTASTTARGSQTLRLRGGGELVLGGKTVQSWRDLYKLLILPVQDSLPPRGSHLTIVPQGPLFRLSFAALQDAQGHYLVENYALNYAPSLGVLRLTGERKQRLGQRETRYLIVADPLIAPDLSKDTGLPPLPGARQEARNLVRLLPHGETTLLMGSEASKAAVREQLTGKTVLHLATHAIVRDDQPLDSFLVLSAGDKSPLGSGRLTMQEIYGMDLQTDLVVLSACSTALGKVSGDGMAGLTRAFFYGGAPSVMATLWDVADEPTSLLILEFYKSLQTDPDKSRALRTAQLRLLRALRAGRVQVNTAVGPVTLPEDPVFWAGFVLQGEP
jgi:CHAT domain-containing protein/tetratricopeptide (TPR) repeat protein